MDKMNYEKLREDLIDYFGSASSFMPLSLMEVVRIESADSEEIVKIAQNNGIDLNKYFIK